MLQIAEWCADRVRASTYVHDGKTQWYAPSLAGASTLAAALYKPEVYAGVLDVLGRLDEDDYAAYLKGFMRRGMARFGESWRYADICTVLYVLADLLGVESYLEIGVRRGRSLAMVLDRRPSADVVGFDLWLRDYAGMENPGPDYVAAQMAQLGHKGGLRFVTGDSARTVPAHFAAHPDATYDLITVDGDHGPEGALRDLATVLPRLRIGGAIVFDDISHPELGYLRGIWQRVVQSQPNMSCHVFDETGYGVAFAIRMR
ncbi:MAG: class I SAM-dependent methyltransferase [Desulfovibrio sp.]|nr:class I SAM-dependent methyltransferase [Desulfovibrio sp.]